MSLRKRGPVWWIDFATPSGERIRRSAATGNKAQAQELHDKLRSDVWRLQKLGDRQRRIWQEAAVRWLREQAHKASIEDDKEKLRWLDRFLADRELESISRALIDEITEAKQAEGCSNATVNRMLALLRAILRKCARDWEWLDRVPAVRLLKEPSRRIRILSRAQARTLLRELPPHLRDMATFALATGLRAGNVTGLTWEQVDLSRRHAWVHPDQAKARRAIAVPLNDTAMDVLRAQRGKHPMWVFTYQGERIKQVSTRAWYRALARAGIRHFRWHDLRHAWASWHVQSGTPLFALQELGGWETEKMVRRYAHLAAEHLAGYAGHTDVNRESQGRSTPQATARQPDFCGTTAHTPVAAEIPSTHGTNTAQQPDFHGTTPRQTGFKW
jgi:integrase